MAAPVMKHCGRKVCKLFAAGLLAAVPTLSTSAQAQQPIASQWALSTSTVSVDPNTSRRQTIEMVVNTSREISADQDFETVRIQNPRVISALPLAGGKLQLSAISTGVTQVDLMGDDNSVHTIEIMVLGDVRELEAILRRTFPSANLGITPIQGGCIVTGYVSSDEHVQDAVLIAQQYFPAVINRISVTGVHTIQLETQIMEVSRTKLRALGVDWALANGDDVVASTVSGLLTASGASFAGTGNETFKATVIEDGTTFFAAVRALRQNSLVKVLASPTLVAVDGRPASFNAGGEIPIVVPAGLGQVGVQYREFGTRLDYVAKVRDNGRIWLEVRPYVSEIDPSRSVAIQGVSVPGLRSRFLETGVEMSAGHTLALGGLLQVRSETINIGIPGLSDMPWVGALFRTTREEQNEIELLITVTPNFAASMEPSEVPLDAPGLHTTSPIDKELFFRGYMETPIGECADTGTGLIEGYPVQSEVIQNRYGTNSDMAVPNPAAMSVGPNAPLLVRQPGTPQAPYTANSQTVPPVAIQGNGMIR